MGTSPRSEPSEDVEALPGRWSAYLLPRIPLGPAKHMNVGKAKGDRHLLFACFLLVLVAGAAIIAVQIAFGSNGRSAVKPNSITVLLPPPNLLRPISREEALRDNASRSFVIRPDSPAAPFRFAGDAQSKERAIDCLTQAVYYEAAADGAEGERAVAQVVLNRVRHPGFPASICGVVYQGANAPGCQFTFTCDGSLGKIPAPSLWKQAREIALQELAGKVFAPIGHATHYHADYVLPYWADSLDKSVQVGHQIFYRLKGLFGSSGAFTQRYARNEPLPPIEPLNSAEGSQALAEAVAANTQGPDASTTKPAVPAHTELLADLSAGALIRDSMGPKKDMSAAEPGDTPKPPAQHSNCDSHSSGGQLRPLAADDIRSSGKPACTD